MREILFRGKRTDNGEWVEGYYIHRPTAVCIGESNPSCILAPAVDPDDNTKIFEVFSETVSQFTGLTDKNGRRIFEGDIILYRQIPCVVKYNAKTAHYSLYIYGKIEISGFNHDTMKLANIIGNIYDNPELLEVKK